MRKIIFALVLATVCLTAPAKLSQFVVRGTVEKQDYSRSQWRHDQVDSVYVALMLNDSIPVDFKMLKGDDEMKFSPDGELRMMVQGGVGSYALILNREGYEPLRHEFKVASEGQDIVYLRGLFMEKRRENTLNEVEVVGTAIKMVMKGDTIVYDSRAFKLAEGSTLDALVRQLPGATLDDDGSIMVNGKKVNSLLINGNDFFNGDPDVALKNLPAYTVDKIKVYDKAAKDDYLTLSSQKLTDSPQEENLVMDVHLKKEFSMATILNVEGGYGPGIYSGKDPRRFDHRYLGRAFVVGFGKNYRWSAYGNANNISNTSKANSSNKNWGRGWTPDGELQLAIGGFDVFWNPTKRWELSADMLYTDERIDKQSLTSTTNFYETGNVYGRSRSDRRETRNHLEANASMRYFGDNLSVWFSPQLDWGRGDMRQYVMQANFDSNPAEQSRGAAIDSLFSAAAPDLSEELMRSLTSSVYQSQRGAPSGFPDRLRLSARLNAVLRPPTWRGSLTLNGYVHDHHFSSRYGRLYDQPYIADAAVEPLRRTQWGDNSTHRTEANASLTYNHTKRFMSERRMRSVEFNPSASWNMERNKENDALVYEAMMESIDPASRPLPSVTAPENVRPLIDAENTFNYRKLDNEASVRASVSFKSEIIAPADSALNPTFSANVSYGFSELFRTLAYRKPHLADPLDCHLNTRNGANSVSAYVGVSSNNKISYFNLQAGYNYGETLEDLLTFVPTVNSSDPLNVYLGPETGTLLPRGRVHSAYINGYYYGNVRHDFASVYGSYYRHDNAVAQTAVFDPATGITTHRPMAVNGNWQASIFANYRSPFGPGECWSAGGNVNYSHNNSVDYTSAGGAPVRSLVLTDDVAAQAHISYKLKNGTRFSLAGGTTWQHSRSPRADFHTISAWKSHATASVAFYLPWEISGETSMRVDFRSGYEDAALNTTEWIWNASVQKAFLKGALTVKLEAVDILGQLSAVSYYVNAQGRTETWTNSLPRYAMLTVGYRFSFTPKVLQSN